MAAFRLLGFLLPRDQRKELKRLHTRVYIVSWMRLYIRHFGVYTTAIDQN